jgi:hypothetical protein
MSVRYSADGERLTAPTGLSQTAYTIMGWVYHITHPASTYGNIFSRYVSSTESPGISVKGTSPYNWNIGDWTSDNVGSTLTAGVWYHIAWVVSGTTSMSLYVNGVLDIGPVTVDDAGDALRIGMYRTTNNNENFNGRTNNVQVYDTNLTAAEILQEMHRIRPVRTANLWAWWPMFPGIGERTLDYSGNGRDLTETGTLSDEVSSPVGYGAPVLITDNPAAAAGVEIIVPTASLTTASFAPQLRHVLTVPNTSLVTARFAPTVKKQVTVPASSLVTARFAPQVVNPQGVVVPNAALTTTHFAPQLKHQVTVPVQSLVTARFVPTVVNPQGMVVPTAALTTSRFAPVVKHQINVPKASLVTAQFVPAPRLGLNYIVPNVALSTTTFAPTPVLPRHVTVPVLVLATTTFAPSVQAGGNVVVEVPVAALTTTRFAPILKHQVTIPAAALTTSRFAPVLKLAIIIPVRAITLTAFAPTPIVGAGIEIIVPVASLTLTLFAPTAVLPRHVVVPVQVFTTGTFAPSVSVEAAGLFRSVYLALLGTG